MFVVQGGVLDMSCYMYIEEKNSLQVYATTAYRIIKKVHCSIYYQHSDNSKFKALYQCGKIKQDTIHKPLLSKQTYNFVK